MKNKHFLFLSVMLLAAWPMPVFAGPCDAYFTFDNSLADASGSGHHGTMIGAEGAPTKASYAEGKFGQALVLDGSGGMRALIDLHWDICPQVTISAWIKVSRDAANTSPVLFSSGQGSGLGLYFSPTYLRLNGTENGLFQPDAVRPDYWMFVAGVYDFDTGVIQLYWGSRGPAEGMLSQYRGEPESAFWIGTENDTWGVFASGVAVDELRITGSALSKEEIVALRDTPVRSHVPEAEPQ